MVKVFTKPNCRDCESTKRWLMANNIEFEEIKVSAQIKNQLIAEGWKRMPVVKSRTGEWSGFNRGELGRLLSE